MNTQLIKIAIHTIEQALVLQGDSDRFERLINGETVNASYQQVKADKAAFAIKLLKSL